MALYDPAPSLDFTTAEFAAWVDTKPADAEYNFCDSSFCAIAQFGLETGRPYLVGVSDIDELLPWSWEARYALSLSETFGALALRLKGLSE